MDLSAAITGVRLAAHCMMDRGAALAPQGGMGRGGCIVAVASAAGGWVMFVVGCGGGVEGVGRDVLLEMGG